jgi:hypothetical protein
MRPPFSPHLLFPHTPSDTPGNRIVAPEVDWTAAARENRGSPRHSAMESVWWPSGGSLMAKVIPRQVLCVLGRWRDLGPVEEIVHQIGGNGFELDREFSRLGPDSRMVRSFEASYDRVTPSMTAEDWQAVREHSAVVYVLSPPIQKNQALEISGRALILTAALLQASGLAVKAEGAGIAHGRAKWMDLATSYAQAKMSADTHVMGSTLYWTWVRRPLLEEGQTTFYSCGMHLLGERDIEIDSSLDVDAATEWIDLLGLYLVADRPARKIENGAGFRLSDAGPRRIIRFAPCERYEQDEFLFNPYGYLRLEQPT